jgi:hypothetical protein
MERISVSKLPVVALPLRRTTVDTGPVRTTGVGPKPRSTVPSTVLSNVSVSSPVPGSVEVCTFSKHLWSGSLKSIGPGNIACRASAV